MKERKQTTWYISHCDTEGGNDRGGVGGGGGVHSPALTRQQVRVSGPLATAAAAAARDKVRLLASLETARDGARGVMVVVDVARAWLTGGWAGARGHLTCFEDIVCVLVVCAG